METFETFPEKASTFLGIDEALLKPVPLA